MNSMLYKANQRARRNNELRNNDKKPIQHIPPVMQPEDFEGFLGYDEAENQVSNR